MSSNNRVKTLCKTFKICLRTIELYFENNSIKYSTKMLRSKRIRTETYKEKSTVRMCQAVTIPRQFFGYYMSGVPNNILCQSLFRVLFLWINLKKITHVLDIWEYESAKKKFGFLQSFCQQNLSPALHT